MCASDIGGRQLHVCVNCHLNLPVDVAVPFLELLHRFAPLCFVGNAKDAVQLVHKLVA